MSASAPLSPQNVLVALPNWVGDAVMATPALRAIRGLWPAASITVLGRPGALAVLAGLGSFDATMADESTRRLGLPRMAHRIRRGKFDVAVLLPNSFRSALLAWLGGVGRIAGYARDGRGWLLNDRLQPQRDAAGSFVPTPAVEYYLALARHLGADASDASMELAVEPSFAQAADELLRAAGLQAGEPAVMLNPGAAFGPSKMWNSERYAALADELIDRHKAQIIINAAPGEATIARQVAGDMRHRPLVNMADHPNSLGLVKALLRRIDLLVTNDTGARHVAAALGRDVVTIFGSTDPAWSQIGFARERMVRVAVPCSPCQKRMCPQTPGPRYQQCMMAVTVEMALAAAEELLASRQHQAVRA